MEHKIETVWKEKMQFTSNTLGGAVDLDADESVGGEGTGVRSKALMLSALSGCTGMDVASLMKKMRLEVDSFKIDVTANLSEEHPKVYTDVHVTYTFEGTNLNHEKLNKCVSLSVDKYCGVFEMFRQFAKVSTEVVFNDK